VIMFKIKDLWQILKDAGTGFRRHKVLKLSAALSFYTIITLGPMILVIIFISKMFWGRQAIEGTIHSQISSVVGNAAAIQIQALIKSASISSNNYMAIFGIITLVFAATTVFTQMQDSMNTIWNVKVRKGYGWQQMLKNRLISFCIIAGLSLLLFVSLLLNGILEGFMSKIQELFPQIAFVLIYTVNLLLTLLVVTLLFAFIFKVLPDAVLNWKDVAPGALFAAVLFMFGTFCITLYIKNTNLGSTYGSAGSLVILLFWIYYSANILYFGAECSKAYALKFGTEIKPKDYAVTIRVALVESNEPSVQQNEKIIDIIEKEIQRVK